jgi:hypothetical protein
MQVVRSPNGREVNPHQEVVDSAQINPHQQIANYVQIDLHQQNVNSAQIVSWLRRPRILQFEQGFWPLPTQINLSKRRYNKSREASLRPMHSVWDMKFTF